MFDPNTIDARNFTADAAVVELDRELQLRISAYGKWIEEGRLDPQVAAERFGAIKKAHVMVNWMRQNDERIKLAMYLIKIAENHPEKLVGLAELIKAFPGATIGTLQEKMKEAA